MWDFSHLSSSIHRINTSEVTKGLTQKTQNIISVSVGIGIEVLNNSWREKRHFRNSERWKQQVVSRWVTTSSADRTKFLSSFFFSFGFSKFSIKIACRSYHQHHHDGIGKWDIHCSHCGFQIRASTDGAWPHWFFHFFSSKGPCFHRQPSRSVEKTQKYYLFLVFELNWMVRAVLEFGDPLWKFSVSQKSTITLHFLGMKFDF